MITCLSWRHGHIDMPPTTRKTHHMTQALSPPSELTLDALLAGMTAAAERAGQQLLAHFSPDARPHDRNTLMAALAHNEALVAKGLRDALSALSPGANWLDGELEAMPLPDGEWWVVDAVEGNVNHVHGLGDWGVSITLVRDRQPVLAVFHHPLEGMMWTAVSGKGAHRNGQAVRVSAKTQLADAIVSTGQAEAGQTATYGPIGGSVTAMLGHALLVRTSVPSTFPMLHVANGQNDVLWQYACMLPGVAAGVLFVQEAGGTVSRIDGSPWQPGATDILMAAPALHAAAIAVLRSIPSQEAA